MTTPPRSGTAARRAAKGVTTPVVEGGATDATSAEDVEPHDAPAGSIATPAPADRSVSPETATPPPPKGPRSSTTRTGRLDPDVLAGLHEERDFLLRSLTDLEREHDAGDVDDVDYVTLRDEYTARTARVLRAIDTEETRYLEAFDARPPRRTSRVVATWVGVVVFAIVAGVGLAQASGRRTAGDQITGGIRAGSEDTLQQAQELFSQGKFDEAIELYDEVLATQPNNAEALTYRGWLTYLPTRGQDLTDDVLATRTSALESVEAGLAADPTNGSAKVFRVVILADVNRVDDARAALDALGPDDVPQFMAPQLDALRTRLDPLANARSLAAQDKIQEALKAYDEAAQADPTNLDARVEKAYLLIAVARRLPAGADADTLRTSAGASLDQAAVINPDDPSLIIVRALLLADQGQTDAARAELARVPADQVPTSLTAVADDLRRQLGG
jgi:tetratricopeptide (TPR) repeat protein